MINEELIRYLSEFEPNEPVSIVVADVGKRIHHKICGYQLIVDAGNPVLMFETEESEPLDEVLVLEE